MVLFTRRVQINKNALCIPIKNTEDEKLSRGTTSVRRFLAKATFSGTKYLSSVTGTPVASYYGSNRFSALLTE